MKSLITIVIAVLISLSTHKKSSQPKDNELIIKIEIKHAFFGVPISSFTLRRGTEVYVKRIKGRCRVAGFVDITTVLVELEDKDKTVMPFPKSRITLAPLRKE